MAGRRCGARGRAVAGREYKPSQTHDPSVLQHSGQDNKQPHQQQTNQPTNCKLVSKYPSPCQPSVCRPTPQTGPGAGVDTAAATMLSFLRRAPLQGTAASVQRTTAGHLLFTLPASAKPAATNSLPVLFTQTNHELISFLTLHYLSSQYRSLVFNQMFC